MKKEIIIPFDGDFSQESRDRLVSALEEQLEKLNTNNGEDEGSSVVLSAKPSDAQVMQGY